jgi:predicted ribosomally synthesized peptide with SipW-like signal peptide
MKLFSLKNLAMAGALSIAGVGLIGVGAHAVWTANTTSNQSIAAGTLGVVISSPSVAACATPGAACTTLTLPALGPNGIGSTFDTTPIDVYLTNTGTVPAYYNTVAFTYGASNGSFAGDVGLCDFSTGYDGHYVGNDSFGTVAGNNLNGSVAGSGPYYEIDPGQSDEYTIEFYAGAVTTACGASAITSLPQSDMGASLTSTLTYSFTG